MSYEDERHRDDPEAAWNKPHKPKSKKNTKRWCKGKVGREHIPVIERDPRYSSYHDRPCQRVRGYSWNLGCYHHEVCSTCGKILRWFISYDECPQLKETR